MVLLMSTLELWLVIGISSIIFFGIIAVVGLCVCWLRAKRKRSQLYTIEDIPSPRKNSFFEIINIYRNFNSLEQSREELLKKDQSNDLMDSTDLSKKFSNSLLRINNADEMCSRTSTGSLRTYYSTNFSRSNSKCTFVSCSEGSDTGEIV